MVTVFINDKKWEVSNIDTAIERIQMAEIFEDLQITDKVLVYVGKDKLSKDTVKELLCLANV